MDVIDSLLLRLFFRLSTRKGFRIKEKGVFCFLLNIPTGVFRFGVLIGDWDILLLRPVDDTFCRFNRLPMGVENTKRLFINFFIGVFSSREVIGVDDSLIIFLFVFNL